MRFNYTGKVLMVSDINAYSLLQNFCCYRRQNIPVLERFIEPNKLFINNKPRPLTR